MQKRFVQAAAIGFSVWAVAALVSAAPQSTAKAKASTVDIMLMHPQDAKSGDNAIEVMVKGADGNAISDADVSVLFVMPAMPAMKMPEMRNEVKLKAAGGGKYTGSGSLAMAGNWTTTISVKKGGKEIGQKKVTLAAK
jgi:hypothetical protein